MRILETSLISSLKKLEEERQAENTPPAKTAEELAAEKAAADKAAAEKAEADKQSRGSPQKKADEYFKDSPTLAA